MKRISLSILLTISLFFGVIHPRVANAENAESQKWAQSVLQDLKIEPLQEGANLPDAIIFITFKGIEYNYRVTKIISNDKDNSVIAQIIALIPVDNNYQDVFRARQYIKPAFNIENNLPKYIEELKLAANSKPNENEICIDPPTFKAYIRENGKVSFYNFNKSCPNDMIYEFRCRLDYGVPCKQVKSEDVNIVVSKHIAKIEKAPQN